MKYKEHVFNFKNAMFHIILFITIQNVDYLILGQKLNLVVILNNFKYDVKLLKNLHTA